MRRGPSIVVRMGMVLAALALPVSAGAVMGHNKPGLFTAPAIAPVTPQKIKHDKNGAVTISADEMAYDRDHQIVIARGHVEVLQDPYVLTADQITYFQQRDLVVAEGNVVLLQPSGDIYFADRAELKDDMKHGVITAFKARLADSSVFVAATAQKVSPSITKLTKASYTPCNLCKDMAPLWQLNARKVKVDEGDERVTYHDTTMDVFGVPVFYTPYLSHPTPDAAAQSGFLDPEYSSSNNLGTTVKVPYYWRIAPDKDAIITPWYNVAEGPVLQEDYHQLSDGGEYRIRSSQTYPKKLDINGDEVSGNQFRGHIYALGSESVTDYSRVGFDINRATDDTYLRRYGFGDQDALFSRAYYEAAQDRNFGLVQGLAIQGLRLGDNGKTTPLVLPILQGYYETPPDENGVRFHLSGDAQSLTRETGVDQNRLSLTGGATFPYVSEGGHIFTSTLNLRQDFYDSSHVPITGSTNQFSGTTQRTLPQAALQWQYPLLRQFGHDTMTIEPIVLAVAQTRDGNDPHISNEDNQLIELTDTNLFSLDRMPGLDTVDSGSRVAYGFRSQYLFQKGTSLDALFGQNYNVDSDTPFPNSTTPGERFSDYIGRVAYEFAPYTLAYRFALDKSDLNLNRNEITAAYAGEKGYALSVSYRTLDNNRYLSNSKEGQFDGVLPFSDEWSIYGGARRDFDLNQMVSAHSGIIYKNECFNIMLDAVRTYTSDRDVLPSTAVTLRVGFKNLGEFGGK